MAFKEPQRGSKAPLLCWNYLPVGQRLLEVAWIGFHGRIVSSAAGVFLTQTRFIICDALKRSDITRSASTRRCIYGRHLQPPMMPEFLTDACQCTGIFMKPTGFVLRYETPTELLLPLKCLSLYGTVVNQRAEPLQCQQLAG